MQLKIGEQVWEFDLMDFDNREVMTVERQLGCSFGEFSGRFSNMDMGAVTAAVWILRLRDDPSLKYSDVRFNIKDLEWITTPDERQAAYKSLKTDEERAVYLANLSDAERAEFEVAADPLELSETVPPDVAG